MANATHIQEFGNQLAVLFDDGSKKLAYPTTGGLWIINGAGGGPGPGDGNFMWPFNQSTVSSEYGPRSGGTGSFHEGIDFGGGAVGGVGTPIPAIGTGVVGSKQFHTNFGNMIIVDHGVVNSGTYAGKQVRSLYAHMQNPSPLNNGDTVTKGATVGGVGNTGGASQGAHLHLEVHITNPGAPIVHNTNNDGGYRSAVNPRPFLDEYSV